MARPRGARSTLIALNYDVIAELAGGIAGNTVRQYAQRGQFNPRDLDSALTWVNDRRIAKGLPLIGLPTDIGEAASDDDSEAVTSTPAVAGCYWCAVRNSPKLRTGLLTYDPLTASYRYDT